MLMTFNGIEKFFAHMVSNEVSFQLLEITARLFVVTNRFTRLSGSSEIVEVCIRFLQNEFILNLQFLNRWCQN